MGTKVREGISALTDDVRGLTTALSIDRIASVLSTRPLAGTYKVFPPGVDTHAVFDYLEADLFSDR